VGVLTLFRKQHIAMMADIESMFHQVRVTPEHFDFSGGQKAEDTAITLADQLSKLLQNGGFRLTTSVSNSKKVRAHFAK